MNRLTPGLRLLLVVACAFLIIGGLRSASVLLVPILLAFFLAVLNLPFTRWLERRGIPHLIALTTTIALNVALISVFVALAVNVMLSFLPKAPGYAEDMLENVQSWGDDLFQKTPILNQTDQLQEGKETIYEMIRRQATNLTYELPTGNQVLDQVTSLTGTIFIVFVVMLFFMAESHKMESRLTAIKAAGGPNLAMLARVSQDIQRYLAIKTAASVLTGIFAWVLTWALKVEFPLLWGITAFALNYIPAIGSIIAAVPPSLLALSQQGVVPCCLVAGGYLAINMVIGNLLEPHMMGRRFGISTSVVVLSVLFWGWVWGATGMFLAIPLTMLVKVILQNTEEFRWISVAMEKSASELMRARPWRSGLFSGEQTEEETPVTRETGDQAT